MIAIVDGVDEIMIVDGQGVDALGEYVFTEGADERSIRLVDDAAGIATGQHKDAIPGIDGDSDHVAVLISGGKALPLGKNLVVRCRFRDRALSSPRMMLL